jgi:hypothetical protein
MQPLRAILKTSLIMVPIALAVALMLIAGKQAFSLPIQSGLLTTTRNTYLILWGSITLGTILSPTKKTLSVFKISWRLKVNPSEVGEAFHYKMHLDWPPQLWGRDWFRKELKMRRAIKNVAKKN